MGLSKCCRLRLRTEKKRFTEESESDDKWRDSQQFFLPITESVYGALLAYERRRRRVRLSDMLTHVAPFVTGQESNHPVEKEKADRVGQ